MKRMKRTLQDSKGFTSAEVLITVCIMGILLAILSASYDALKANMRFSQVKGDMDAIAKSAYNDYSTNAVWAPLTFASMPSMWAVNGELTKWPHPPCPGWYYSWEDWSAFGYPVTQVTLRRMNNTLLWGYCLDTAGGSSNCQIADPIFGGSGGAEISSLDVHHVYCNE